MIVSICCILRARLARAASMGIGSPGMDLAQPSRVCGVEMFRSQNAESIAVLRLAIVHNNGCLYCLRNRLDMVVIMDWQVCLGFYIYNDDLILRWTLEWGFWYSLFAFSFGSISIWTGEWKIRKNYFHFLSPICISHVYTFFFFKLTTYQLNKFCKGHNLLFFYLNLFHMT